MLCVYSNDSRIFCLLYHYLNKLLFPPDNAFYEFALLLAFIYRDRNEQ